MPSRWQLPERVTAEAVDVVVAVALLAGSLGALATLSQDRSPALAAGWCVVCAGAVAARRYAPVVSSIAALVGLVGYEFATHDPTGAFPPVAVVLTFYTIGRSEVSSGHRAPAWLACSSALAACVAVAVDSRGSAGDVVSAWTLMALTPLAAGIAISRRHALSVRLGEVAAELRAEQGLAEARAQAEERNRVARDLHDVVAHSVGVMVVQAGAARLVAPRNPAAADEALDIIGRCGRDALADLRRIVGVLRRDVDRGFGGGSGVVDLTRLADQILLGGVAAQVHLCGDMELLSPAVDLVVYRVAQEALTNVVKHAGAGATAVVHVSIEPTVVTVKITNTAGTGQRSSTTGAGHGLLGMHERVATYGGQVLAGPVAGGGYAVHARIPLVVTADADCDRAPAPHPRQILRDIPAALPAWFGNAAIVAGWLVAMEIEVATSSARRGPWQLNALAVAGMALAAGWRRRYPLLFLALVGLLAGTLSGGLTSLDRSTITGLYSLAIPLFTVAAWDPRTRAVAGLGFWLTGAGLVAVVQGAQPGGYAGAAAMGVLVWTAGRLWRAQRALNGELAATTAQLAAERNQRAELAASSERTRIARDLHGPVAQSVVAMVVQAEAARNVLIRRPALAEEAIREIETTGRDALSQLRRILGVLRTTVRSVDEEVLA